MYKRIDFTPDSRVANNILSRLAQCDKQTIKRLYRLGFLRNPHRALGSTSIIVDGLEEYAKATNSPLRAFFFDSDDFVATTYTARDAFVLNYLNRCNEKELELIFGIMQKMFPCKVFYTAKDYDNYRHRLTALFNRFPYGILRAIPKEDEPKENFVLPPYKKVSDELLPELQRFNRGHRSFNFAFSADVLPDMATYVGVSLHWIFDFKAPLFCLYQTGDLIFDYYTLMQPEEQQEFIDFLIGGVKYRIKQLSDSFFVPFP